MLTKRCFKCLCELPLTAFYKHAQMGDGHLNKCKECTKKDAKATRLARIDYYRSYDNSRASMPHRAARRQESNKRYVLRHPERKAATTAVRAAVMAGKLTPMPCLICGAEKTVAHHPVYDLPLDVVWLCQAHHRQAHTMIAEVLT